MSKDGAWSKAGYSGRVDRCVDYGRPLPPAPKRRRRSARGLPRCPTTRITSWPTAATTATTLRSRLSATRKIAPRAGMGRLIQHREPNVGAQENAPESLGGHRADREATKSTSGVWRRSRVPGCWGTKTRSGCAVDACRSGGSAAFGYWRRCSRRGRRSSAVDPFTRLRSFVRNVGGVACFQQDEFGLAETEILTFLRADTDNAQPFPPRAADL